MLRDLGGGHPVGDVLLTDELIAAREDEIAAQLLDLYEGEDPLYVGILMGGAFFTVDLMRALVRRRAHANPRLDFIRAETYREGQKAGETEIVVPLRGHPDLSNTPVVLLDDLCDKNKTLPAADRYLRENHAARHIFRVVLMNKPNVEKEPGPLPDIVGFDIPSRWVYGRGPDAGDEDIPDAYRWTDYVAAKPLG